MREAYWSGAVMMWYISAEGKVSFPTSVLVHLGLGCYD